MIDRIARVSEEIAVVWRQVSDPANNAEAIESFVGVIGTITDLTDLLALNAAIEGARAGQAGRGFAFVAAEVKLLAESAGPSLESITKLVSQNEHSVRAVETALDGAESQVASSVDSGETVRRRFEQIVGSASRVADRFTTISDAIGDLATNTQEIERSAAFIADMATQTSELASR
jgi:methyl-accepting chemotaxis protein